jgi:tetraacyldisaccharide 4'-kinase
MILATIPIAGVEFLVFNATDFREVVSGRRRGVTASVLRGLLRLLEVFYTAVVRWRNRRYDRGGSAVRHVGATVISVGNLTLGGTGKTPLVQWLAEWFQARGVRAAVVSRGYGAAEGANENDEAAELRWILPEAPHVENPDRVAAANDAIRRFNSEVIVLDDAFQHRRIARDLDVVLLDALEPFGFDHVFPRGTLREPIEGLRRADVVVLSRADRLSPAGRAEVWKVVHRHVPRALCAEAIHAPRELISAGGRTMPLESVRGQTVAAFCGIGNPAGFRHTLETLGCKIAGLREFPDHYRYTPEDVDALAEWSHELGVSTVLCTCKDLVKLQTEQLGSRSLWAVRIEMEFQMGQESFESRLETLSRCNKTS